jgi:putative transposase
MDWKQLLAYITGSVDQELLLRNEYLVTENRMLRQQIRGRLRLSDSDRKTLAQMGKKLGKQALQEVATIAKPDTILAWHRKLVTQKFDGSQQRKRHGIPPASERKKTTTWHEFIHAHMDVLVATDFFTTEVWTWCGLVTYDILFFIRLGTREVHVAGVTPPDERWMMQIARNATMANWGILFPGHYLIHDCDRKFCPAFQRLIDDSGVMRVMLPPQSPNLNAYAERWVRSVKEEALSRLILFGERALWHTLNEYVTHYHQERPHQSKGNVILMPCMPPIQRRNCSLQCRERLGGLLKYYYGEAA